MYIAKENQQSKKFILKDTNRFMIQHQDCLRTKIILYGGLEHGEFLIISISLKNFQYYGEKNIRWWRKHDHRTSHLEIKMFITLLI